MTSLHAQKAVSAPASTKIRLAILSTALVDALGGPAEFQGRSTFKTVTSMIPNQNFALPAGVWTDDTSMTLCLARSLATFEPTTASANDKGKPARKGQKGGFDEKDQIKAYMAWWREGKLSATGNCFDIGTTISRALTLYASDPAHGLQRIQTDLSGDKFGGNGSLMRVLPVGLAYWRNGEKAKEYARRSSATTHPNEMCMEACEVWTGAIVKVIQATNRGESLSKLDLIQYFTTFPYASKKLRDALTFHPSTRSPPTPSTAEVLDLHYRSHHPLLKHASSSIPIRPDGSLNLPDEKTLPSTGYVLHTLVAALYCFFSTDTFEDGAIVAVNLGHDADTVGAIYAGLAGCWYASDERQDKRASWGAKMKAWTSSKTDNATKSGSKGALPKEVFWTERVKEWRKALVERALVEEVAEELVEFSERLGK